MYSTNERSNLLHHLIDYSKTITEIQGFLLVGSGSVGFRDDYSDLDVLVVVKNSEDTPKVQELLFDFINRKYKLLKHKVYRHEEDIYVTCYFFDNYLELDLGIWSFSKLRATKPNWELIYDKENTIQEKLEQTLKQHGVPVLENVVSDSLSFLWQFVHSAAISIKREKLIKAIKDMEVIRDQLIRFICIKEQKYYDYDKNIDEISSPYVKRLKQTYEIKMDVESVKQAFIEVMKIYFAFITDELEENEEIYKNKQVLLKYIEEMLQ